jgi:hypothetical protein
VGSGRDAVRRINASVSRSMYMFNALAAPTTNAVPSMAINSRPSGRGPGATNAPQSIVTMTKPARRGLPSSAKAEQKRALVCSELSRSPLIPGTLDCILQHLRPFSDGSQR